MALIVEDGTGIANAESYTSVAEADAYFLARANEAWDAVDNKEAALRNATDFLEATYGSSWRGYRRTNTQALSWPRIDVAKQDQAGGWPAYYEPSFVPPEVKRATAELALIADQNGELTPNLDRTQSSVSIGPISVTYDAASPELPRYPKIDAMLSSYLVAQGVMVRLVRT